MKRHNVKKPKKNVPHHALEKAIDENLKLGKKK